MTSFDESRLLNKLDNDYESNRSKMWYMTLRKALMILKADLTTKSSKMNELDDCLSKLKNPAYQLIFDLASEKMRDVTKRLEEFFMFFEDYNKLERMCETLVLVTRSEKIDEQPQPQAQPSPAPIQMTQPPQLVQMVPPPTQPTPQPQPIQLVQPQQQLQLPPSSFNTLSLTPKASHNQSPLSTPIRSFLISTTDLFEDIKTPEKVLSSSSPFSTGSLSTPKASTSDSLSTPRASYRQRNSFVVKDLMKEFKTPVKQAPPPSPLSVIIASSEIPMLDFNLSPTRSPVNHSSNLTTTTTTTNNTPSITNNSTTTTTMATISKETSPSMAVATLPRGVLRSKRVSLEKFQHYNSIGLKRRAENAPVRARQQQLRKLAPKTIIELPTSSSTQNPLTTQFLKTMNVDQFLSKIHDENDKL